MQAVYKKIIVAAILVVSVVLAIVLSVSLSHRNAELKRLEQEKESLLKGDGSSQVYVTPSQMKSLFSEQLAKIKEYGVLAKNVENHIDISYIYRDSTRYRDTLVYVFDTVRSERFAPFDICTPCWSVFGTIVGDTVELYDVSVSDDIDVVLYKEKRKCLFERRKIKAIAYSGCKKDTLKIIRNLKVEK